MMRMFGKNVIEAEEGDPTEIGSVVVAPRSAEVARLPEAGTDPTSADLIYGYSQRYAPSQSEPYLGQVLSRDQISWLMGAQQLPTPRALVKVHNFFRHVGQSPITPALGVLALAGLAAWVHDQPYHPFWGGGIIAVGGFLIHSGIHAHKKHGADADPMFTKGAVGAGLGAAFIGTGVTAGFSPWLYLATAVAGAVAYGARAGVHTGRLERARQFAVGLVAAGNTGPALPGPVPSPWAGPVSDEEYRLRQAFAKLGAPEVIISPARRINEDTWSVFADLIDTKTTAEAVAKETLKIATWTGARRVEALPGARPGQLKLIVHDGDDPLEATVPGKGPRISSILEPLPFAMFEDRAAVEQVLAFNHGLVAGATDGGKSGVMTSIIIGTLACGDVVRILVDCKSGAPEFGVYRPVAFHMVDNPADGMRVLAGLEALYEYRGKLLEEMSVPSELNEDGVPVRKWRPEFGPFVLAAIDELSELTISVKGAAARIQRLNALVRYVGIIRLDATQTPSRNVFGGTTDARLNYQFRVGLGVTEPSAINIIMGQGAQGRGWRLDRLGKDQGKIMVQSRQHDRPRIARAEWYDDEQIARYVAEYADFAREHTLDEGSANAYWDGFHAELDEEVDGGGGGPRGGQPQPVAPQGPYGRPHLVVVPAYPGGAEVGEKDVRLWQLLGEYGRGGATAKELAARAEVLDHKHTSQPWVRSRLEYWRAMGYVGFEENGRGRETVHWRTDLRVDEQKDA